MAAMSNMSPQALAAWEQLNATWGKPLTVNSAYRDPAQNAAAGGAKRSQHMHGNAFDVSTAGLSPADRAALVQAANSAGFTGYGGYNNALHLDVGPRRTWGADYTGATTPDWLTSALGGNAPAMQGRTSTRGSQPMTPTQQAPQGILEMMGIQKRDPSAQDQTALPFYQRDQFKNTMGSIAMAANTLRQRPDEGLSGRIQASRQQRADSQSRNKTVEYLRANGREDLASMVEQGMISGQDAASQLFAKPAVGEIREVNGQLVRVMPDNTVVELTGGGDPSRLNADQLSQLNALRDDATTAAGDYSMMSDAWSNVQTFYTNPGAVSDKALVVAFAKILDPGSVVREGEAAAIANAGSLSSGMISQLQNALAGTGVLPQQVRDEIASLSRDMYANKEPITRARIELLQETARRGSLPPELVWSGTFLAPELPPRPAGAYMPPTPDGVDPDVFAAAWAAMTKEAQREYLEGN